jgi:hypothetical protein
VRIIPWLVSSSVRTFSPAPGSVKLGQPQPESNFTSELNNSVPQAAHLYAPRSFES